MDLRTGNLWKKIMLYSVPLMFTHLLELFFNIADIAIAGKFAGPISLGAIGSTSMLITLTTGWLIGVSNGVNAQVAFYIGGNEKDKLKRANTTGIILCLASGVLTMILSLAMAEQVIALLGTKQELMAEAVVYFKIYMLGAPALAVFNFGNAVLTADGETKKPLRILCIAGAINVLLNLFFIKIMGMNSNGVAIASIISHYLSAAMIMLEVVTADRNYRLDFHWKYFDRNIACKILNIGIPAALQYSLFSTANLFVQSAVNSFDHVVVEGNSAAMNFDSVVYTMMTAFYAACTSFIAQNYGAKKKERILKTYFITTFYAFAFAAIAGVLIYFFRSNLLYIFTNDAEVVKYGAIRLGILSLTYCLSAPMDNATAACRGLGKTLVPTIIILMGSIVFRILWIYTVFAYFHTLQSLYLLYCFAFVITSIGGNIYFFYINKKVCMHMLNC